MSPFPTLSIPLLSGSLIALAACQKPSAAVVDENEVQRLNRGIVEISQKLQDREQELAAAVAERDQLRREVETLRAQASPRAPGSESGEGAPAVP